MHKTLSIFTLCLVLLNACQKETPPPTIRPVRAVQAQGAEQVASSLIFPGLIRAYSRADLAFRIDGMILDKPIVVGQQVHKEDILLKLDPREYEIALKKAMGTVDTVQAQLNFAERDYTRMVNIYNTDPGAISLSLVDRKKETINQLKGELVTAEAEKEKSADDLKYTLLKAPFDGRIAAIYVEAHEQVKAKQAVVRLLNNTRTEMEINVPEKYISQLLEQFKTAHFKVKLDAFPNTIITATIKEIGTESSSTTRTFPVVLTLTDVPENLQILAGMSGSADLRTVLQETETKKNALYLPKEALFSDGNGNDFVWKVDASTQTVQKQKITVIEKTAQGVYFNSDNVHSGDWIVNAGVSFLTEGQKVRINE